MKKVLVTGATGFIGRHCLNTLLRKGYEVHAVSGSTSFQVSSTVKWHAVDLLNRTLIKSLISNIRPIYLLHFAWYAVPGQYWTSNENFAWVQSSLELLKQFHQFGGKRVVMAGTCAEYNWDYGYCSEFITPNLYNSAYSVCKASLQKMLSVYSESNDLSSAWGRIFFLYGPYEPLRRLVSSVIVSLLKEEKASCSHGNQFRDYLYVQDVADAFVALLESEVEGPVNIGSGEPIQLKSIIKNIAEELNREDLVEFGTFNQSAKEPFLVVADRERLLNEVGWSPKWGINEGLQVTIDWWKDFLKKK